MVGLLASAHNGSKITVATTSTGKTAFTQRDEKAHHRSSPSETTIKSTESTPNDETSRPGGDDVVYPSTSKQILTMISVAIVVFLISLDRTILATATPTITNEFNSVTQVGWYASSYMLTMAAFMLLFGRIYTFYNPKVVFMICISLFEIGSAISGAAPNSVAFIVGRAISGIGASAIMGGVMVIVFVTIPLHRRPLFQASMSAVWGISSVAGPLLGGAFTTKVTWRWCFYINLPLGGAVLAYLFFFLHIPAAKDAQLPTKEKLLKLDPIGTAVLIPCIVCLLLALQWGGSQYAWSDWRIILLLVLFGILLIAFIGIQIWKQESATIPPRLLKQRSISFAATANVFSGATLTIITYYLPIWFQAIQRIDAVQSGIRVLPMVVALAIASTITGASVSRLGYYTPFMIAGFAIMTVGTGLLSLLTPDATTAQWLGYQVPFGFGLGMAMQQANIAAQTVLERKDIGTGAALMFFCQSIGGSVFVSIAQSIFSNKLAIGLANIPGFDTSLVTSVGATDLFKHVPEELYAQELAYYNDAITKGVFYVAVAAGAAACVAAMGVEWKSVKGKMQGGPARAKESGDSKV